MRVNIVNQAGYSGGGFSSSGSTLSGPLILVGDPTGNLEAATKQYVDNAGNSLSASSITTGILNINRLPAFSGDLTSVAGSNILTLSDIGVVPGSYTKVTTDAKGRVIAGSSLTAADIPNLTWSKITSGLPTTLSGYGITDGLNIGGGTLTNYLTLAGDPTTAYQLATKRYVDSVVGNSSNVKVGDILQRPDPTTPTGFLRCNGGQVSKIMYPALYSAISSNFETTVTLGYTPYNAVGAGQPWRQQYDFKTSTYSDLGSWGVSSTTGTSLCGGPVVVTSNRVYSFGGYDVTGNAYSSSVITSKIADDGSIVGWYTAELTLPAAMAYQNAVVIKNKVYIFGGQNDSGPLNSVYSSVINSDGTLNNWVLETTLPEARVFTSPLVTKNRVYLIGGYNGTTYLNTSISAPINTDGTLGAWVTDTNTLNVNLAGSSIAVTKNRVYLIGGYNGAASSAVQTATINTDGTLSAWATGTSIPATLAYSASAVFNNRVFLIGGYNGSAGVSSIYTAPINSDGTLGSWVLSTYAFTIVAYHGQAFVTNNCLYVVRVRNTTSVGSCFKVSLPGAEGISDYSNFYNGSINKFDGSDVSSIISVYTYKFNYQQQGSGQPWRLQYDINKSQVGDIGSWATGTSLGASVCQSQAIVTKNRVYLLGGSNGTSAVANTYTAPINTDGTLGSWVPGTALPVALANTQALVIKNKVYLIGGNNASYLSTVYVANINADGTLGAWSNSNNNLPELTSNAMAFVTTDKVYVLGGVNGTVYSNAIYYANIKSDGTLTAWATSSKTLPVNLAASALIVTKNRVYLVGGVTATNTRTNSVYSAAINQYTGRLGDWYLDGTIPAALSDLKAIVTNSKVYLIGGWNGTAVTSTVYTTNINIDGTLGTWGNSSIGISTALCYMQVICTKSRVYSIGGYTGSAATSTVLVATGFVGGLNDYTPYYNDSITPLDPDYFYLPDTTTTDMYGVYSYIKY